MIYVDPWVEHCWNHCGIASSSQSCFMTQIEVGLIYLCAGKKKTRKQTNKKPPKKQTKPTKLTNFDKILWNCLSWWFMGGLRDALAFTLEYQSLF